MAVDWNYRKHATTSPDQLPFPHMHWAFDCDEVRRKLGLRLPGLPSGATPRIVDVYHRPSKSLDVCYAFGDNRVDFSAVTMRFSKEERGGHAFRKARKRVVDQSKIFELDNSAFGWIFPEDCELPALMKLGGSSKDAQPFRLLSYRRGSRAAIKQLRAEAAIMKIYGRAALHHDRLVKLFANPARKFRMAEPLSCSPENSSRRETFLDGCGFEARTSGFGADLAINQMLSALVALHNLKISALPVLTATTVMRRYQNMFLRRVELSGLPSARICEELGVTLAAAMPDQNVECIALHGDLHIGNVLFLEREAALIDLDEMACGDPAYDLSMFGSQLVLLDVISGGRKPAYTRLACDLPALYEAASSKPINEQSYAWYVAALLASRHIKSCVNHAVPDVHTISADLVRLATRIAKMRKVTPSSLDAGETPRSRQ